MGARMKRIVAIALLAASVSFAAEVEGPAYTPPLPTQPEPFVSVTAKTGAEWVAQCARPAEKSEYKIRFGACISYLKGARDAFVTAAGDTICATNVRAAPAGAMQEVSFEVARNRPTAPIGIILAETFAFYSGKHPCPSRAM